MAMNQAIFRLQHVIFFHSSSKHQVLEETKYSVFISSSAGPRGLSDTSRVMLKPAFVEHCYTKDILLLV